MVDITTEIVKQSVIYPRVINETNNAELWHIQIRKSHI
jgi:hypothetical protein